MSTGRPHTQENMKRAASGQERRMIKLLLMLAAVCALVILVRGRIYVLREIEVTGNSKKSVSEIAGRSGLQLGMNIFNVDEREVERNLLTDPYVELLKVRVELPDTVVLEVRERSACAAINCAGVILLTDQEGYILERLTGVPQDGNFVVVSGMDVSIGHQGNAIESGVPGQKAAMSAVLQAIHESGMEREISELNVADMDNLYLVSDNGIQVLLGDETNLNDKFAWMRAVMDRLKQDGVMSGVLDLSSGKNAVYADR